MSAGTEESLAFAPRYGPDGLLPAIVTDARDGTVLMLAYMNADALEATQRSGEVHFWSRSRRSMWRKGETSGQILRLIEMRTDCDQDALLIRAEVQGDGNACHTGRRSCFYRQVSGTGLNFA